MFNVLYVSLLLILCWSIRLAGLGLTHCLTLSPHSQDSQTGRRPPAGGCSSSRCSHTSPWTAGGGGDVGRRLMLAGLTMLEDRRAAWWSSLVLLQSPLAHWLLLRLLLCCPHCQRYQPTCQLQPKSENIKSPVNMKIFLIFFYH